MKKAMMILVAGMMLAGGSAMAADHAGEHDAKCLKECQMLVKNCNQEVDSLPQRIARLQKEIKKGSAAYSADELRVLERKLKEAEDLVTNLNYGG